MVYGYSYRVDEWKNLRSYREGFQLLGGYITRFNLLIELRVGHVAFEHDAFHPGDSLHLPPHAHIKLRLSSLNRISSEEIFEDVIVLSEIDNKRIAFL